MASSSTEVSTTIVNPFRNEEFLRMNEEVRRTTGLPLVDVDFIKFIAKMRANPEKYNTAPPPVPEGYEVVVDVRNGKGTLVKLPEKADDDGDASSNATTSE